MTFCKIVHQITFPEEICIFSKLDISPIFGRKKLPAGFELGTSVPGADAMKLCK
jgi:hypothetical protein